MKIKQLGNHPERDEKSYLVQDEGEEHIVRIFTRPGRRLCTCDCYNGTRFCNEPTICKHKIQVILKEYGANTKKDKNA
jgi:hypothetical protein